MGESVLLWLAVLVDRFCPMYTLPDGSLNWDLAPALVLYFVGHIQHWISYTAISLIYFKLASGKYAITALQSKQLAMVTAIFVFLCGQTHLASGLAKVFQMPTIEGLVLIISGTWSQVVLSRLYKAVVKQRAVVEL